MHVSSSQVADLTTTVADLEVNHSSTECGIQTVAEDKNGMEKGELIKFEEDVSIMNANEGRANERDSNELLSPAHRPQSRFASRSAFASSSLTPTRSTTS